MSNYFKISPLFISPYKFLERRESHSPKLFVGKKPISEQVITYLPQSINSKHTTSEG